jgi:hypothetical protein
MSAKAAFILDLKKVVPNVDHDGIETAWKQELELRAAQRAAEEKAAQRAAEEKAAQRAAEEKAAEREFELEKLRIVQQRGGNGKFFLCYMRSLWLLPVFLCCFLFSCHVCSALQLISLHPSS